MARLPPGLASATSINAFDEALRYLHEVKHVVHRDIKPENLLVNLKGDAKITDFGVTAGLHDSCATFVGTVTYMSPERIRNSGYSYSADIWSLGLMALECARGRFPYVVNGGLSDLMLQIPDDPSPTPPKCVFCQSSARSSVLACRKMLMQGQHVSRLLSHPFIKRYKRTGVDLSVYVKSVYNPAEILKQIAEMAVHYNYYLTFDGSDKFPCEADYPSSIQSLGPWTLFLRAENHMFPHQALRLMSCQGATELKRIFYPPSGTAHLSYGANMEGRDIIYTYL
ncbi:hypothetical protein ACP70R_047430 [Stipagrostis hirtigluma subsp. patula]